MNVLLICGAMMMLYICRLMWARRKWYALSWRMPGSTGIPFFGTVRFFNAAKVIENMEHHSKMYGKMSKVWIGPRLIVCVSDPVLIEQILNSPVCLNKGESYKFVRNVIGLGLVTMEADDWRTHRKLLNPSFHYNITSKFVPIFNKHFRKLVECLAEQCAAGSEFDILHSLKNCSMDMICETTMDNQTQAQDGKNDEYLEAIDSSLAICGTRIFNVLRQPDWMFWLSKYHAKQKQNNFILEGIVKKIIEQKMAKLNASTAIGGASKVLVNDNDDTLTKEKHIFIDRVLKLSLEDRSFTLADVLNECNTILIAGFETTATTMSFVILMLGMYPHYQQRVYDELQPLMVDGRDVSQAELGELKFLDMFIKETLRVFPVLPFLTRTTTADIQIGKYVIPNGTELMLNVVAMHMSKDNYPYADTFDPDNFLPEHVAVRHAFSYIPFSGGQRSCIGTRYANIVLKMSVVYVLKSYRVSTSLSIDDLKFRMNVTLNLLNTHRVRLHRRDGIAF